MQPIFDALAVSALKLIGNRSNTSAATSAQRHRDPNEI